MKERITPCLWFDQQTEEAGAFYTKHLTNTKIVAQSPVVTEIEVAGQGMTLLNGGPIYQANASISFFYVCDTEEEIERLCTVFSEEGSMLMPLDRYEWAEKYAWLNDRFGISWQFWLGDLKEVGQRLTPSLLFTGKQYGRAEEAIEHYSSIFKKPKQDGILRYGNDEAPEQAGKVKHAEIWLNGQKFMLTDSMQSPDLTFSEGVSLTIHCETQDEIDYYWEKLTENGEESMCGWLKDKFGVSWQVIPNVLSQIMGDPEKAGKAAQAFREMRKFDIEKLVQASI